MARILAIRPEPGLGQTCKKAAAKGLAITGAPLFEVRPQSWEADEASAYDGLLIGSANVFLHGGGKLAAYRHLPVYAVGEATAAAARSAGFSVAAMGKGGLQNVLDEITPPARLLRLAAARRVKLNPPPGITIHAVNVYETVPLALQQQAIAQLDDDPIVLLHSAYAAQHFASECARLGLARRAISLACLGPRIAEAAGEGWRAVHIAKRPDDEHLLEMTARLCQ